MIDKKIYVDDKLLEGVDSIEITPCIPLYDFEYRRMNKKRPVVTLVVRFKDGHTEECIL